MTAKKIYQGTLDDPAKLDLFQTIRTVHWNTAKGLVVITFSYQITTIGPDADGGTLSATVSDVPYGGSYDIMGSGNTVPAGVVEIQNPVTAKMRGAYYQWAPVAPWTEHTTTTVTDKVWVIDQAMWYGYYKHNQTFQAEYGTREEARLILAAGFRDAIIRFGGIPDDDLDPGSDPPYTGFSVNYEGPLPPDPVFFAGGDPGHPGIAHEEDFPVTQHHYKGRGALILNMAKIKKLLDGASTFDFHIVVSKTAGQFTIELDGFFKRASFPFDAQSAPTYGHGDTAVSRSYGPPTTRYDMGVNVDVNTLEFSIFSEEGGPGPIH